jgi:hypothetical protein
MTAFMSQLQVAVGCKHKQLLQAGVHYLVLPTHSCMCADASESNLTRASSSAWQFITHGLGCKEPGRTTETRFRDVCMSCLAPVNPQHAD